MHGPVPPIQIYIHVLLHRLAKISGNHFNGPYRVTETVKSFLERDFITIYLVNIPVFVSIRGATKKWQSL